MHKVVRAKHVVHLCEQYYSQESIYIHYLLKFPNTTWGSCCDPHLNMSQVRYKTVKHLRDISQWGWNTGIQTKECGSKDPVFTSRLPPLWVKQWKFTGSWQRRGWLTNHLIYSDVIPLLLLLGKELSSLAIKTIYSLYLPLYLYFEPLPDWIQHFGYSNGIVK